MAGGYTLALPEEDRTLMGRNKLVADMIGLMGGRAAEEIVFNDITSGASNDLERVTKMARAMVTRLGMSNDLGPMVYGQKEELIFLGREISEQRDYSEAVAEQIDKEVRLLVNDAYEKAKRHLIQYRECLDSVARKLLEVENLNPGRVRSAISTSYTKKWWDTYSPRRVTTAVQSSNRIHSGFLATVHRLEDPEIFRPHNKIF